MSKISLQPGLALTPPQSASIVMMVFNCIRDNGYNFNNSYISLAACNTYQELYPGSEKFSGFAVFCCWGKRLGFINVGH